MESDFPFAALRVMFSQTVALLLKYTKTAQKVHFSDSKVFFCDFFFCDSHSQADCWSHKAAACNRGCCFPFISPYFAREGGVRNVEGVGAGESQHSS